MKYSLEELKEIFTIHGIKNEIIDTTEILCNDRGMEIKEYLKSNPQITKYAIIDDRTRDIEPYFIDNPHVVFKVHTDKGLSEDKIVNNIINYLNC